MVGLSGITQLKMMISWASIELLWFPKNIKTSCTLFLKILHVSVNFLSLKHVFTNKWSEYISKRMFLTLVECLLLAFVKCWIRVLSTLPAPSQFLVEGFLLISVGPLSTGPDTLSFGLLEIIDTKDWSSPKMLSTETILSNKHDNGEHTFVGMVENSTGTLGVKFKVHMK